MPPVIFALRLGFGAGIDREAIKTAPKCFAPMHANLTKPPLASSGN
jgi:hypothetical protein